MPKPGYNPLSSNIDSLFPQIMGSRMPPVDDGSVPGGAPQMPGMPQMPQMGMQPSVPGMGPSPVPGRPQSVQPPIAPAVPQPRQPGQGDQLGQAIRELLSKRMPR